MTSAKRSQGSALRLSVLLLAWSSPSATGLAAEGADTVRQIGNAQALTAARSWTYQLQKLDVNSASREAGDLLVTDYSLDGSDAKALSAAAVGALKERSAGGRRLVVAYLSIGEAESYRFYWQSAWGAPAARKDAATADRAVIERAAYTGDDCASGDAAIAGQGAKPPAPMAGAAPEWLHQENTRWRGNYLVRYWHPEWQALMFGSAESYLDRILAAGFDGVYLDRADAHENWRDTRPTAEADMVQLIARLSAYAKERNPDFLVILQNAEELTAQRTVRDAIDGVAKEDLLHGLDNSERANCANDVAASLGHLQRYQSTGFPVFGVEYLTDEAKAEAARATLARLGIVGTIGVRALDAPSR